MSPERIDEWDRAHTRADIHFRARNLEQHQAWLRFKYWCEDNGLDTCHVVISQVQAFNEGSKQARALIKSTAGTMVFNQQNTFISQVDRPRREFSPLSIQKGDLPGTTSSSFRCMLEDHILLRALQMRHSFCFKDFPNLSPDQFKKTVLRLRKKELITTAEPRTCPRFYRLAPKFLLTILSVNTRVRHLAPNPEGIWGEPYDGL